MGEVKSDLVNEIVLEKEDLEEIKTLEGMLAAINNEVNRLQIKLRIMEGSYNYYNNLFSQKGMEISKKYNIAEDIGWYADKAGKIVTVVKPKNN